MDLVCEAIVKAVQAETELELLGLHIPEFWLHIFLQLGGLDNLADSTLMQQEYLEQVVR